MPQDPLGIVAGKGEIALLAVREAKAQGRTPVVVTYDPESEKALRDETENVTRVGVAQIGKTIGAFKKEGVTELLLVGKVDKRILFKNPKFDLKALAVLRRLRTRTDDTLMLALVDELAKEGLTVIDQGAFFKNLTPGEEILTRRPPTDEEKDDITFGMRMARGIAGLDIGQTVVVKKGAVLAVEAIDGTDETIQRGGAIAGGGAVVCKVAKPCQDSRFDIPTIGVGTITGMAAVKATVLAFEAGATLVVDREGTTAAANQQGVTLIGVTPTETP